MSAEPALSDAARERTVATLEENREAWEKRPVVRRLYRGWFDLLASRLSPVAGTTVELGSGFGALRETIPDLVTTDVVASPWADRVADAANIPFDDGSLANLALVDVLHHVPNPRACFEEAERVLAPGGRMVMIEPYCAPFSALAYSRLHEEDLDLDADPEQPQGADSGDPFNANIALPTILFWRRPGTVERWAPGLRVVERRRLAWLVYPLSGGFSRPSLVPQPLLGPALALERLLGPVFAPLAAFRCLVVVERT